MKHKIVEVEWVDSTGWDGWHSLDEARKEECISIKSIGYVVSSNRKSLSITGDIDSQQNPKVGRQMSIPRGCIKGIRRL